jgi:ABC-type transport system involved in cytochrome c biogenesis permease component
MFGRVVWLVLRKDLTVEVRSLEIAYTTIFFAVSCVLVFAFALVREGRAPEDGAAGILWIAIAFAGTLALGRAFERERQSETLRAPLVALLFQAPLFAHPFWLAVILLTGTIGFAAVGTLFAAMLVRARTRDVLLPVLLYPITVPVIIAGVRATATLLQPDVDAAGIRFWLALLGCFDVVFVTLALWTFEPLMTD